MSEDDSSSGSVRAPSPPSRFRARPSRAWVKVSKPAPLALPARDEEPEGRPLPDVRTLGATSTVGRSQAAPPQAGHEHAPSKPGPSRPLERGLAQAEDLSAPKGGQTKTQRAPLKSALRVPRAAARPEDAVGPVASTSKLPVQSKPPANLPLTVDRYKTPARRRLGPVPDGAWAIATLSKLAAEREDQRSAGNDDDDLAVDEDAVEDDLDQLPAAIQTAYATLIPRTASKILRRSASLKSRSSKKNKTPTAGRALRVAQHSDDDERPMRSARRSKATRHAAHDASRSPSPPPPPPTHRFAGSETVNRLSSKAKTRYLRRTATGQRRQVSLEPPSQDENSAGSDENDSQGESSDDLYAPGPVRAPARGRGKKRGPEPVETPDSSNVKRLKVGAPARGAFLQQVDKTAFSPLLIAKTPKTAPSRLQSISVLEKSIDRTRFKSKSAAPRKDDGPRRMKSLAFCAPEEADAVGAVAATSPSTGRLAKAAVMPAKNVATAGLPRTTKPPARKKQRMRIIPARLPPPVRLVDIVRANGKKAATDVENAPDLLEKADIVSKSAKKARRKPTFRFATGPGAKRAPTVMYDAPTALKRQSEDSPRPFSPESPIRSSASADLKGGRTDPNTTPSAALGRSEAYPDGKSRATTPGRLLRRLSVMPPRGLDPDVLVAKAEDASGTDYATVQGQRMTAEESGQPSHGSEASYLTRQAHQAKTGHEKLASASSASSSDEGLSSSAPPNPSGNRIRLWLGDMDEEEEETQQGPQGGGQRSRTASSASSGIWSHLPTQFDHRFDVIVQDHSARPASEPSGGPTLSELEAAAQQNDVHEDFRLLSVAEQSVPVSEL
ncbi:hypothetical protein RHOSPDRAFT_33180 [Rhodotorula sp. JG-1b]|nr:hypothetical protein RHOSPDRAFT_33180 [Rhodotorula sp. JG-1b]